MTTYTLRDAIRHIRGPVVVVQAMQMKGGIRLPNDLGILVDASHYAGPVDRMMEWTSMFLTLSIAPLLRDGPPRYRLFILTTTWHLHEMEIVDGRVVYKMEAASRGPRS